VQTSFEQSVPLSEVTFVVVDLETTGGSPVDGAITEIGAVKTRGGETLGTFQTLVDPERPIPPYVAQLTGIDDRAVAGAPSIGQVLPSYLEFARGAVFVAHNASYDRGFLDACLLRLDHAPVPSPVVCTAKLARRVVWPDVPNVRLATLARYFRTRVQPSHRALADARATAEILDGLLDLGTRLGIHTLGELLHACSARGRPNFGKIRLADDLPAGPGVYRFRGRDGAVLYVGTSRNVRSRVKRYFYGDERKRVQDLIDEVAAIDGLPTASDVEALALEARLIAMHEPPYNRRGTGWRRSVYLRLDDGEAWPRLKIGRGDLPDGATVLGPFPTRARAVLAQEALTSVSALRRCTRSMGRSTRFSACALADIGRCLAPCDGRTDAAAYAAESGRLRLALRQPGEMLLDLEADMQRLADAERFEEAALARERLRALVEALWRARVDAWLATTDLAFEGPGGVRVEVRSGTVHSPHDTAGPIGSPPPRRRADELAAVRSWVVRHRPRLLDTDAPLHEPIDGGAILHALRRRLADAQSPPDPVRRRRAA
jgi:DNA polymerase-3 subunit epsilon